MRNLVGRFFQIYEAILQARALQLRNTLLLLPAVYRLPQPPPLPPLLASCRHYLPRLLLFYSDASNYRVHHHGFIPSVAPLPMVLGLFPIPNTPLRQLSDYTTNLNVLRMLKNTTVTDTQASNITNALHWFADHQSQPFRLTS